jgi:hypothetical protein
VRRVVSLSRLSARSVSYTRFYRVWSLCGGLRKAMYVGVSNMKFLSGNSWTDQRYSHRRALRKQDLRAQAPFLSI